MLAIDIIEYLHLPCLRSQAHFPMAINGSLGWHRISRKMFRRRLVLIMFINAPIKHIGLSIPCLPHICGRNLNLIEIVVSVMITLRPSFMKTIHFGTVHLYFVFAICS